jgi:hypothetical protein
MTLGEANGLIQSRWGIRSAAEPNDLNGAAFALMPSDDVFSLFGAQAGQGLLSTTDFLALIRSTCQFIKDYPDSGNNRLIILKAPNLAMGDGYANTLKKYNSVSGGNIIAVTGGTLSGYTADQLYNFVVQNIQEIQNLTQD